MRRGCSQFTTLFRRHYPGILPLYYVIPSAAEESGMPGFDSLPDF